ncbi:MAG TPA: hypothetical protein VMU51_38145 [Mycobacteriales bacterium]|jgi:hypothetical protein|nr:hypothetical protein [Mycobacteriales bacterium]
MVGLLVLLFPFVLLGFMVVMERVESPLRQVAVETQVETFLDEARPEELDTFVREGLPVALERFKGRRRLSRLLPLPRASRGRHAARAGSSSPRP